VKQEKALFAESIGVLEKTRLKGFSRLYFGHETCERCLPSLSELEKAKKICSKNAMGFSLVTPFCTDAGIKKVSLLMKRLSQEDELVVNDFGLLFLASKKFRARLVAGRLLNRQYRDPRIALFKKAPEEMRQHLRLSHSSNGLFRELVREYNVERVELDNLLQGIATNLSSTALKGSLYYPFVFIAATRFCLAANCDRLSHAGKVGVFPCGKECLKYRFILESSEFNRSLFLFGNALYFENNKIPKNLGERGIDRLVFTAKALQPEE
jgi:hypothetical protein